MLISKKYVVGHLSDFPYKRFYRLQLQDFVFFFSRQKMFQTPHSVRYIYCLYFGFLCCCCFEKYIDKNASATNGVIKTKVEIGHWVWDPKLSNPPKIWINKYE